MLNLRPLIVVKYTKQELKGIVHILADFKSG